MKNKINAYLNERTGEIIHALDGSAKDLYMYQDIDFRLLGTTTLEKEYVQE